MPELFQRYVLPSGAEIEIQNLASASHGVRDVSRESSASATAFEKVIEPLGELCEMLLAKITTSGAMPKAISLELGLALKGKTSLVLVAGESEATLKVKLEWSNK